MEAFVYKIAYFCIMFNGGIMIHIIDDFLSKEELDFINERARLCEWYGTLGDDHWSGRTGNVIDNPRQLLDHPVTSEIIKRQTSIIHERTGNDDLVPDLWHFARWLPGNEQHPHADAEEPSGAKHPMWWREWGCIIYVNDDYEGGEVYFPNQDMELKPKPGQLVFFPGTLQYLHGVKPVLSGERHTIASFWTSDRLKGAYWL